MKTLIDLINLMNAVQRNEIENNFTIKASVDLSTTYYQEDDTKIVSFSYTLMSGEKRYKIVDFSFGIEDITSNEIQKMYYTIICDCRINL